MVARNVMIAFVAGVMLELAMLPRASAGLVPTMTASVGQRASDHTLSVTWRGYGPGLGFGVAAGFLAGAAAAYGSPVYYYGAPAPLPYARPIYAAPYAYPQPYAPPVYPGYFAPYGYYYGWPGRCYTQEGYGRYRSCSAN